jgi:hypothetical protein
LTEGRILCLCTGTQWQKNIINVKPLWSHNG